MMTIRVTENDVRSFQKRLEEFGNSLAPAEQLILVHMLESASQGDAEVVGHGMNPLPAAWASIRGRLDELLAPIFEQLSRVEFDSHGQAYFVK